MAPLLALTTATAAVAMALYHGTALETVTPRAGQHPAFFRLDQFVAAGCCVVWH